jgi:hypothetical protein
VYMIINWLGDGSPSMGGGLHQTKQYDGKYFGHQVVWMSDASLQLPLILITSNTSLSGVGRMSFGGSRRCPEWWPELLKEKHRHGRVPISLAKALLVNSRPLELGLSLTRLRLVLSTMKPPARMRLPCPPRIANGPTRHLPARYAIHHSAVHPANVAPILGTGPPPEPPVPQDGAREVDERVARKRRQLELLNRAKEIRAAAAARSTSGQKTSVKRRFWEEVSVREVDGTFLPLCCAALFSLDAAGMSSSGLELMIGSPKARIKSI